MANVEEATVGPKGARAGNGNSIAIGIGFEADVARGVDDSPASRNRQCIASVVCVTDI